jgi:hypothetical protein
LGYAAENSVSWDRSIVPVKHGSLAPGAGEQVEGGGAFSPVPGTPEQLLKTTKNVLKLQNLCESQ